MARRSLLGLLGLTGLLAACSTSPAGTTPAPRPGTPEPTPLRYGPDPAQYAVLHLPPGAPRAPLPVVVVIHGGYWRAAYGLELGTPLAVDLTNSDVAVLNVEYRRVGAGGGFPQTLSDVAAAIDLLATEGVRTARSAGRELDLGKVVLLGHSAGGHLAAWAGSRTRLQAPATGADPVVVPAGVVSQAGVLDLVAGAQQNLGGGAVVDLLGGDPVTQAARYAVASPTALVPAPCPVVAVHGTADDVVPIDQSRRYVAAATAARGQARLVELPGVDHFQLIDPATSAWNIIRGEVLDLLR
ncbi:alpha/beta hydrolase family protein [Actinomycetospora termitidis]|uniref:Alpha/beta fold hydrolase n=1 Tax=Actinomycetospora termitidis TaxID=3053470 RepID=A0ABT7MFA0_9PSEU|nr:alpha/beta fold hydrolase [Actinomycetospora sp. Odt1-22]MDL5159346.1 alpha/beta fold hydrolase [Actinomycetospora sp. Odt1-22]